MSFEIVHGVDILEINRFDRAVHRWGDRFLKKIFTPSEISCYSTKPSSLASRFAAKEAIVKALGAGILGWGYGAVKWREIEILSNREGKPLINLYGKAREKSEKLGLKDLALSLSDTETYALASVVGIIRKTDEDS